MTRKADLESTGDEAIAACGGDVRGAIRALLVTLEAFEAEIEDYSVRLPASAP